MLRPRYIAFTLAASRPISRRAFSNALKGRARQEGWADDAAPQLTRYEWPNGIIRVEHDRQAAARGLLGTLTWVMEGESKVALSVETVSASGTLKALTGRVGFLKERGETR